jgi:hypothetical protein
MTQRKKSIYLDPALDRPSSEKIFPHSHLTEPLRSPN